MSDFKRAVTTYEQLIKVCPDVEVRGRGNERKGKEGEGHE